MPATKVKTRVVAAYRNETRCFDTVNEALKAYADLRGCKLADLRCESNGPSLNRHYRQWGQSVWVYEGEFDADHAALVWVPPAIAMKWRAHRGVCELR